MMRIVLSDTCCVPYQTWFHHICTIILRQVFSNHKLKLNNCSLHCFTELFIRLRHRQGNMLNWFLLLHVYKTRFMIPSQIPVTNSVCYTSLTAAAMISDKEITTSIQSCRWRPVLKLNSSDPLSVLLLIF